MKIKNFQNKLSPKVYYLIGALKDGCLTKQWAIKFSQKDKTWFSSTLIPVFNNIFGTNFTEKKIYKEDKEGRTWCLIICNKKIWLELKKISETTPKTKEEKKYYIRGFWDADGGCPKNPTTDKKIYIKFTQKNKNALIQMKNLLKDFGIKSGNVRISETTKNGNIWRLSITNKLGIINFCENINSDHPKKQRLDKIKEILLAR